MMTLKQARMFADKSQKDLANVIGVHVQTYRKIEQDPTIATIRQALALSEYLGVSYDQIFFDSNSTKSRFKAHESA